MNLIVTAANLILIPSDRIKVIIFGSNRREVDKYTSGEFAGDKNFIIRIGVSHAYDECNGRGVDSTNDIISHDGESTRI